MGGYFYRAFGLVLHSDLQISSLVECQEQTADVTIRRGEILPLTEEMTFSTSFGNWKAARNCFYLAVSHVAEYLILDGNQIIVQPYPNATGEDVGAFLVSSAIAALLQQRKLLLLHASAVRTSEGAILFVGRSGIGKSTTLAAMVDQGYEMLADDVAAIDTETGGAPTIIPAVPIMRLRPEALRKIYGETWRYAPVRKNLEKYLVPTDKYSEQRSSVRGVFLLDTHESENISTEKISFSESFYWLSNFTFRKRFYNGLDLSEFHFNALTKFLKSTQVVHVRRPEYQLSVDELCETVMVCLKNSVFDAREKVRL